MEIQDIIQGLTSAEIAAISSPEERTLIVNETLNQAVIYVNGTFKQASFVNTDDIPEGVKKFATSADLAQITANATNITNLQSSKEDAFTKNTAFNKDFGTSSSEVCEGDDSRLSDSRTPTSHASTHESGGADEINVNDLSGVLSDNQKVATDSTLTGNGTTGNPLRVVSGSGANISDIAISQGNLIKNIITAATLTSNVNNWSPTGFDANTDMIRVDINANQRAISGIVAPSTGVNRILAIKNINTASLDLRFQHNSSSSLPANRFLCRDNNSKSIKPNETALWFYDHIVQRWTPFNRIG